MLTERLWFQALDAEDGTGSLGSGSVVPSWVSALGTPNQSHHIGNVWCRLTEHPVGTRGTVTGSTGVTSSEPCRELTSTPWQSSGGSFPVGRSTVPKKPSSAPASMGTGSESTGKCFYGFPVDKVLQEHNPLLDTGDLTWRLGLDCFGKRALPTSDHGQSIPGVAFTFLPSRERGRMEKTRLYPPLGSYRSSWTGRQRLRQSPWQG